MTMVTCPLYRVFNACDENDANSFALRLQQKGYHVFLEPFEGVIYDHVHKTTINVSRIKVNYQSIPRKP